MLRKDTASPAGAIKYLGHYKPFLQQHTIFGSQKKLSNGNCFTLANRSCACKGSEKGKTYFINFIRTNMFRLGKHLTREQKTIVIF